MSETVMVQVPKKSWKMLLWNPFLFVAGGQALGIGVVIMAVSAYLGYVTNTHFDGVLDIHKAEANKFIVFLAEVIFNWLSISVVLMVFAMIGWRRSTRIIDIFGTQALARWPYVFAPVLVMPGAFERVGQAAQNAAAQGAGTYPAASGADMAVVLGLSVVIIGMLVYTLILMYKGFSVSCNAKGWKAIVSFIIAVVLAEALSKLLIMKIPAMLGAMGIK